ncbi:MAG: TetR family transcriptional regulator [Tetrasphaera sp.]|nr:TetR family transcriptional regulator [Tetrasphaera sp.]
MREPRQERTRVAWQRILDAGVAVLEDEGAGGFTIDAICARASVVPRAVYDRVDRTRTFHPPLASMPPCRHLLRPSSITNDSCAPSSSCRVRIPRSSAAECSMSRGSPRGSPRLSIPLARRCGIPIRTPRSAGSSAIFSRRSPCARHTVPPSSASPTPTANTWSTSARWRAPSFSDTRALVRGAGATGDICHHWRRVPPRAGQPYRRDHP